MAAKRVGRMKVHHHRPAHSQLPANPLVTKFLSSSVDARSPTLPIFRQYKPSSNGAMCSDEHASSSTTK